MSDINNPVQNELLTKVEKHIDWNLNSFKQGSSNISRAVKVDKTVAKEQLKNATEGFFYKGDELYFISRILFKMGYTHFSMFCGHQSIENFLKGFLLKNGYENIAGHDLENLFNKCKVFNLNVEFFENEKVYGSILKYSPYYETPRYPVLYGTQPDRPMFILEEDIWYLDYFVHSFFSLLSEKYIKIMEEENNKPGIFFNPQSDKRVRWKHFFKNADLSLYKVGLQDKIWKLFTVDNINVVN